jgi:hypothetical protein
MGHTCQAIFLLLLSCYLLGLTFRHFDGNLDPLLMSIISLLVLGLFSLSFALFRRVDVSYSVRDGAIRFERPKGTVRWHERLSDISEVSRAADWFWEQWVVLKCNGRRRHVELLPSLKQALDHAMPPNKSLERTREK